MMTGSHPELPEILDRCQKGIAAILRPSVDGAEQADAVADLLRELLPDIPLVGCSLRSEGTTHLAIRATAGHSLAELERSLPSPLSALEPLAPSLQRLPTEALGGLHGLAAAIQEQGRSWGYLLLGMPPEAAPAEQDRAEAVLALAAPTLAVRCLLASLQRERTELAHFALVGQAFAGLAHDLNNSLNSMMLQTSVVQLRVDPQIRQELAAIRQHGAQAAGLVRSLQHVVQERREQSSEIDLRGVLTDLLTEEAKFQNRVVPHLGSEVPCIHSTRSAARQLVQLLLEGVCAATKGMVNAETTVQDGGAVLDLKLPDLPNLDGADGQAGIDVLVWQNLDEVGRFAGQSLLRQLGGVMTIERHQDHTSVLRVVWRQTT